MEVNIQNLIDDARCYEAVRDLRWPEKTQCPHCNSDSVIRRGKEIQSSTSNVMNVKAVLSDLMI